MSEQQSEESALFAKLAAYDTPTICNALELVIGERQDTGFTRQTMIAAGPSAGPFVGRARTATLRAIRRPGAGSTVERRIEYFRYIAQPGAIVVIEDLDRPAGLGAFWGEVHSTVHASLQIAGVVTNGSVRDLDDLDPRLPIIAGSITPSHAFVDIEQLDIAVNVFGMTVQPNDVIHADQHGAVVIPDDALEALPAALDKLVEKERVILSSARQDDFDLDKLEEALRKAKDIH